MLFEVTYKKRANGIKLYTKYVEVFGYGNVDALGTRALHEAKLKHPLHAKLVLTEVGIEEAKNDFCKDIDIFAKDPATQILHHLTPSLYYGSHASSEELFYRSMSSAIDDYDSNGRVILCSNKK